MTCAWLCTTAVQCYSIKKNVWCLRSYPIDNHHAPHLQFMLNAWLCAHYKFSSSYHYHHSLGTVYWKKAAHVAQNTSRLTITTITYYAMSINKSVHLRSAPESHKTSQSSRVVENRCVFSLVHVWKHSVTALVIAVQVADCSRRSGHRRKNLNVHSTSCKRHTKLQCPY